jgi:hypothetical protein
MNFYADDNPEIIAAVAALLKCDESGIEQVKFAVSYPHNGNHSITTLEIYPVPMLQALFFIYTPGRTLSDVIAFRNNRSVRVSMDGKSGILVYQISRYMMGHVGEMPTKVEEEENEVDKLKQKDLQIQQLRDRNRVDKNTIQSLRNQAKILRNRKSDSGQ